MGVFLAEPITKALNEALTARAALSELRRVLEIIVPLAYRPPIKVDKQDHELELYDVLTTVVQRATPFHCRHDITVPESPCFYMQADACHGSWHCCLATVIPKLRPSTN